jgi:large subunit ribosomal protein L13
LKRPDRAIKIAALVPAVGAGFPDRNKPMRTISAKPETVQRGWYLVDAEGRTLGRLATELARRLRGKHKPIYTPHVDTGDYLVVVNASKIRVTGRKLKDKTYYRWTGYVGNLKTESLEELMARAPDRALRLAVKGMLPKNSLGTAMLRKLKVYAGAEHDHAAQQPQPLKI